MKGAIPLTICLVSVLTIGTFSSALLSPLTIGSQGSIFIPEEDYVRPFGFRIADIMVDILLPNFDDRSYSSNWQAALDDLAATSPNDEITHVQLRIFWKIDPNNRSTWEHPTLGSNDPTQQAVMNNWKRWLFGAGTPSLAYGPSAVQRIRQAGFKLELCMSVCWNPGVGTLADATPVWDWGGREADYSFNGELFLDNYLNNVLLPVVNFVKDYFGNGDILMLGFEMVYPTADFAWSHNQKWISIIDTVRSTFRSAGKSVVLTIDHCGWFDDFGLGYNAVKLRNAQAPISSNKPGISGASYLGRLDFISVSWWLPLILSQEVPSTWNETDISWVSDAWFNNKNFFKVGTGYGGVPGVYGRDVIADFRALTVVMNKTMLLNTGWENCHGFLSTSPRRASSTVDNQEQRLAWKAQLAAIRDQRSNYTAWCAGQDFERYCRDKAAQPSSIDTSWRNAPAQEAIISDIRVITSPP